MKKVFCIEEWLKEDERVRNGGFWGSLEQPWKLGMTSYVQEFGNEDDFKNWTLSNETFEIIAKYVRDWISETAIDLELAIYVFDGLMKGLRSNTFTIQDVDNDEPVVRNFINALI